MEREIVMGGIGGQGVQLATKILAHALNGENKYVMHFAAFGGTVRGGDVECTVVTGTSELSAPPIIPKAWMSIAMHPNPIPIVRPKTRWGGIYVTNSTLITQESSPEGAILIEIPASKIAEDASNPQGASMTMIGALSQATDLVGLDRLIESLEALTPSYRQHTIKRNVKAFEAGANYALEQLGGFEAKAWVSVTA